MADRKITDLTALNADNAVNTDIIHVVDISEADAADRNKSMTLFELERKIVYDFTVYTSAASADQDEKNIFVDSSAGPFTLTLPPATGFTGKVLRVKKDNSELNKVTLAGFSTELISGSASIFLLGFGESVMLISDGTDWRIFAWEEGAPVTITNAFTETNNIATNSAQVTFKRETIIYKEGGITWSGSAGTAVAVEMTVPGGFSIDTSRGFGGTSNLNHSSSQFGLSTIFTTGWFHYGLYYESATTLKFSGGGASLLYSDLTANDSIRFVPNTVVIPIL